MYPENYEKMSIDDRKAHWLAVFYRGMRWAGEDGLEEESIFDEKLISDLRKFDPEIEAYMPEVLSGLAISQMTDPYEFIEKLNNQMHTNYKVDKTFIVK